MEARHVRWAMQHDWYRRCSYHDSGKWKVFTFDSLSGKEESFECIDALKHWAGY